MGAVLSGALFIFAMPASFVLSTDFDPVLLLGAGLCAGPFFLAASVEDQKQHFDRCAARCPGLPKVL